MVAEEAVAEGAEEAVAEGAEEAVAEGAEEAEEAVAEEAEEAVAVPVAEEETAEEQAALVPLRCPSRPRRSQPTHRRRLRPEPSHAASSSDSHKR